MEDLGNMITELSLANYSFIRSVYWVDIFESVDTYLTRKSFNPSVSNFRSFMKKVIAQTYKAVAAEVWKDTGNTGRMDADTREFIKLKILEEQANVSTLALRLRGLVREGPVDPMTIVQESTARSDGYSKTLDSFYANIKLMSKPSVMLTFTGDDGLESCKDCTKYKGQRHRASWWISRNAVPPSRDFECGGYHCQHVLVDDQNNLYTI